MYCPECGSQLDNDMLFCPECGTKVEKPSAKDSEDSVMKGILFTHIPNLAQKLAVSPQEITNLLETFIRLKAEQGVLYRLADAGVVNPEKPDVPLNKNDAFQKVQKRRVQEKR